MRVTKPLRHLASCLKDQGIAARGRGLDHPELVVFHHRVERELGKIAANEREMVAFIEPPDAPDSFHRNLIPEPAPERIARIRRVDDDTACTHDVGRAPQQPWLRIVRMNGKKLGH